MLNMVRVFMSMPSATVALLASVLIIGCATKGDQLTPAETALEKKDQRGWSSEEGRIRLDQPTNRGPSSANLGSTQGCGADVFLDSPSPDVVVQAKNAENRKLQPPSAFARRSQQHL